MFKNSDEESSSGDDIPIFPPTCRGKLLAPPRHFNQSDLKHDTKSYVAYDWKNDNRAEKTLITNASTFDQYDNYRLVSGRKISSIEQFNALPMMPDAGVRLDDKCVSLAARSGRTIAQLHEAYPAEFDRNGDLRSRLIPLGSAAKHWFDVGDMDINNRELKPGQEGFYYLWHRGISLLCGAEGFDPKKFLVRPSYHDLKLPINGLLFDKRFPSKTKISLKVNRRAEAEHEQPASSSATPAAKKPRLRMLPPKSSPYETLESTEATEQVDHQMTKATDSPTESSTSKPKKKSKKRRSEAERLLEVQSLDPDENEPDPYAGELFGKASKSGRRRKL